MSAIAYDILAVSISMIASKSTFSADRRILNEMRSKMTNEIIEMLFYFKDAKTRFQDKDGHNTTSDDDDDTHTTDE